MSAPPHAHREAVRIPYACQARFPTYGTGFRPHPQAKKAIAEKYAGASISFTVTVEAKSLEGAFAFDGDDVSDTKFEYKASRTVGFALGSSELAATTDYAVAYYGKVGTAFSRNLGATAPTKPGEYLAVLTGADGSAYKGSTANVYFTIDKVDLSDYYIEIAPSDDGSALEFKDVKDKEGGEGKSVLGGGNALPFLSAGDLVVDGTPVPAKAITGATNYESANKWTVSLAFAGDAERKAELAEYIVTPITAEYWGDAAAATWQYDGDGVASDKVVVDPVDLSGTRRFDPAKIKALTAAGGDELAANISVQAADANYEVAEGAEKLTGDAAKAALATPGYWKVTAEVDAAAADYAYKGVQEWDVYVKSGDVAYTTLSIDGNTVEANGTLTTTFDGTDLASKLVATAYVNENGKPVAKGAGAVTVTIKENGKEVSAMRDAGTYTVTLSSGEYAMTTDETFTVKVNALAANAVAINGKQNTGTGDNLVVNAGSTYDCDNGVRPHCHAREGPQLAHARAAGLPRFRALVPAQPAVGGRVADVAAVLQLATRQARAPPASPEHGRAAAAGRAPAAAK